MKITTETPIYYFIKNESNGSFHHIELEAYLEIPQKGNISNFQTLEDIRLFVSKDLDNNEIVSFHYEGGRNDCIGHWANNKEELVKQKESESSIYRFKTTDRETYLNLREEVFKIYLAHPKTDFEKLKVGSEYNF